MSLDRKIIKEGNNYKEFEVGHLTPVGGCEYIFNPVTSNIFKIKGYEFKKHNNHSAQYVLTAEGALFLASEILMYAKLVRELRVIK